MAALFAMHSGFFIFFGHPLTEKRYEDQRAVALKKKMEIVTKKNLFMLSSDCVLFISSFVHRYI
jgi:lipid A disaccharide synthetase